MKDAPIRYVAGGNPDTLPGAALVAESENAIDVVSVGFRYKFGGTPSRRRCPPPV